MAPLSRFGFWTTPISKRAAALRSTTARRDVSF